MAITIRPNTFTATVTSVSSNTEGFVICFEPEYDGVRFELANPETDIPKGIGVHRYGAVVLGPGVSDNTVTSVSLVAKYQGAEYTGTLSFSAVATDTITFTKQ